MVVLIVDDTDDVRSLVATALKCEGFEAIEANGGPAALSLLNAGTVPDIVLLDVQMPEMDGWQTLEAIRSNPVTAGIPVVMCTVKGRPEDMLRGWELGCDGYIRKPFDLSQLYSAVREAAGRPLDQRAAWRESEAEQLRKLLIA